MTSQHLLQGDTMSIRKGSRRSNRRETRPLRNIQIPVAILGLLLCLHSAPAAESRPDERPVLLVPLTDSQPTVDGKLEEPCWKDAARTGPLAVVQGEPSESTTEAFILRDADHLYVGVRCVGKGTVKGEAEPGKPPKEVEAVELFIDSNGDRNSYYRIRIVPEKGGQVTSFYVEDTPPWRDRTWQPQFQSAAAKGTGAWAAEFALPLAIFNKNKTLSSRIGFNVCRTGMPGNETYCWRGTPGNPDEWGILAGIPARESLPRPEYSTVGLNRFYHPPTKAMTSLLAEEEGQTIPLGPGSAHPGTTGEVKLELEGFVLAGDHHARGIIWDLAVDQRKGELYLLSDTRPFRGVAELRVFDRQGKYLRTIMPLNPTLPRSSVRDLCLKTAREGGTELVIPKLFAPFGEFSMYGDWWHHPQKMALAPDGDLIMSNVFKGTLWRIRPDGSLPREGWTSAYHRGRNEPFQSTAWTQEFWHAWDLKNYMPFCALRYPYFCFDSNGLLYVSAGQSTRPTKLYAYYFEVGEQETTYHWEVSGKEEREAHVWKCRAPSALTLR